MVQFHRTSTITVPVATIDVVRVEQSAPQDVEPPDPLPSAKPNRPHSRLTWMPHLAAGKMTRVVSLNPPAAIRHSNRTLVLLTRRKGLLTHLKKRWAELEW